MPTLSAALARPFEPPPVERLNQSADDRTDRIVRALRLVGAEPDRVDRQIEFAPMHLADTTTATWTVNANLFNNALVQVGNATATATALIHDWQITAARTWLYDTWTAPTGLYYAAPAQTITVTATMPSVDWQAFGLAPPNHIPANPHAERQRARNAVVRRRAQRRGVKLLLSLLDEAQQADYARTGTFLAVAPSGTVYRLRKGRTTLELDPVTLKQRNSLCVHMAYGYVHEDSLIANLIGIMTDEQAWRRVANVTGMVHTYSEGNFHTTSLAEAA